MSNSKSKNIVVSEMESRLAESEEYEESDNQEMDDEVSQVIFEEVVPLNRRNYKRTLSIAAAILFFLHLCLLAISIIVVVMNRKSILGIFYNYNYYSNPFIIISIIVLFIMLILLTVYTSIARIVVALGSVLIFITSVFLYFAVFGIASKGLTGNLRFEFVVIQYLVLCCVLGNLVTVLTHKREFPLWVGLLVSFVTFTPILILLFLNKYDPAKAPSNQSNLVAVRIDFRVWRIILYYAIMFVIDFYFAMDNYFISRYRSNIYRLGDSLLIFVHYQTDWTFRFFRDYVRFNSSQMSVSSKSVPESRIVFKSHNSVKSTNSQRSNRTKTFKTVEPNL